MRGLLVLWVAVLIFSAANSVIAKLGQVGAHHLIDGRNPISFCNVLFTANIIAGITLYLIHVKTWTRANLAKIRANEWFSMLFMALISGVLGPTLLFLGLMLTEVINVVLVSTLEIPLTLLFGYLFFREKASGKVLLGAFLALLGVVITFLLHKPDAMPQEMQMTMINIGNNPVSHFLTTFPRTGEICVAIGTLLIVFSVEYTRKFLADVPIGIFSVFRMIVGSILFFGIVLAMLGWVHFIDIFSPFLWEWMLLYGGVIIAGGLFLWFWAMRRTTTSELAIANATNPVTGICFAYLILGEIPERGQYIGGVVVLLGIVIALFDRLHRSKKKVEHARPKVFTGL